MKLQVGKKTGQIEPGAWNGLCRDGNPLLSHEFLNGLELCGCTGSESGWEPFHLALYDDAQKLVGAAPLYLKYHSWGEYIFDWAWADAYQRAGLQYYPKLLGAIPFTPVTGPRLLTDPDAGEPDGLRALLADGLVRTANESGVSSLHILFTSEQDNRAFEKLGLMRRTGNQFHWQNENYESFTHYLSTFTAAKRKKLRRERRRIEEAGITMETVTGDMLKPEHWQAMYRFYRLTVFNHGAAAYLNRAFFEYLQSEMARDVILVLARDGKKFVGGALYFRGSDALYGRYWGADSYYSGLHFETCYYQPIEYCIRHRIRRFEAGAQGEHKLSRGLLPTPTYSLHWLRDPRFRDAIADFLQQETEHVDRYSGLLNEHAPFRNEGL